jgi:hypothetical protein
MIEIVFIDLVTPDAQGMKIFTEFALDEVTERLAMALAPSSTDRSILDPGTLARVGRRLRMRAQNRTLTRAEIDRRAGGRNGTS